MVKEFIVTPYGHKKWGIQYLPNDFATSTKKYPLLVYFHGTGQTGTTKESTDKLLFDSPFPFAATVGEKFIIIALQHESWSPPMDQVAFVIKNDSTFKDRITNVFLTGLSSGGQEVMKAVTTNKEYASIVTAIVPFSSPGYNISGTQYAIDAKIKIWGFAGLSDNVAANGAPTKELVSILNGKFSPYPETHGGWQKYYDPNWKENGQSIYDWLLAQTTPILEVPKPKVLFELYDNGTYKSVS